MKIIIHVFLMTSLCLFGSHALATNHNHHGWKHSYKKQGDGQHWKKQEKKYNFQWSKNNHWNKKGGWQSAGNGKGNGWHHGGGHGGWHGKNAHSVPELDSNAAPLAGLLLSGLLAAGYERRRRKQLKTLKN